MSRGSTSFSYKHFFNVFQQTAMKAPEFFEIPLILSIIPFSIKSECLAASFTLKISINPDFKRLNTGWEAGTYLCNATAIDSVT